ncbi:SDR family oxidoreductase [Croceicoccus sp. BE223]|uniref:SDR family NAD(P)-dependent oxidoreductase n=1 Tax=Croceicoccus sp. BE223 TaxID=2817716 RepID=UPI002866D745|nr:SDR family oxidoreductase [Croceicoccus sp. BE223]MDR7104013.1 NAD(P)-dependent dehydrogenase (short-subunit alcohol dehydrogenase family) [Croceicoccus sp. BE223]
MSDDFDFTGKTALITGASSGIGLATARWLEKRGLARLLLADIDDAALMAHDFTCAVERMAGDVSSEAFWVDLSGTAGSIDLAVLSAGIAPGGTALADTDFAEWRRCMAVNVDGVFLGLRAAMHLMPRGGSVVVMSSVSGIKPYPGTVSYATSKAAVVQLMRVAAAEGARQNIRVNAVAPGPVDTPIWDKADITGALHGDQPDEAEARAAMMVELARGTMLRRVPDAAEIAGTIGFLLSDMAANMTGMVLLTDGGATLRV